jgi:hypothetical protein
MNYIKLIRKAWDITINNDKLKWLSFVPSMLGVCFLVGEIIWQSYLYLGEFGIIDDLFWENISNFYNYLSQEDFVGWFLFILVIFMISYFIIPSLITGVIILAVRHQINFPEEKIPLSQKIIDGTKFFFPIFEFNALTSPLSFVSILFFTATAYRYFHGGVFDFFFLPFLIVFSCFAFILWIFFSYAQYFIVFQKESISDAIKSSVALVFTNFTETIIITFIVLFINIRIVFNILIVFGIPAAVFMFYSYYSHWALLTIIITSGIVLIFLASYITAIMEIFIASIWEQVFNHLYQKKISHEAREQEIKRGNLLDE